MEIAFYCSQQKSVGTEPENAELTSTTILNGNLCYVYTQNFCHKKVES